MPASPPDLADYRRIAGKVVREGLARPLRQALGRGHGGLALTLPEQHRPQLRNRARTLRVPDLEAGVDGRQEASAIAALGGLHRRGHAVLVEAQRRFLWRLAGDGAVER